MFEKKDGKVIVVDSSGAVRQLMAEVVRNLGFSDVQTAGNIQDTINIMEVEQVGWIITPLFSSDPINALTLLKMCNAYMPLRQVRISIIFDEKEAEAKTTAFSLGMMSAHSKPFTKDSLADELGSLLKSFEESSWDTTKAAGSQLRSVLKGAERFEELLSFERNMVETYPSDPRMVLNLVEPLAKANKGDEAYSILNRVAVIDPSLKEEAEKLAGEFLDGKELSGPQSGDGGVNILGIKTCVLIEPDETVRNSLSENLKQLGVENIESYEDGEEAWNGLKGKEEPSLIVQEWKLPKVNGPILTQRFLSHGFLSVPIVIFSSLVKEQDLALLREIGIAGLVEKPFDRTRFNKVISWTMQQERAPTDAKALERKIRQLLKRKDEKNASILVEKYVNIENLPEASKALIQAEYAYFLKDYQTATERAIDALKGFGDSIFILNLLGKIFLKMEDFENSLRCFEKAQSLSPLNVSRICMMAEVNEEMGNTEGSQEALDQAKKLDAENDEVKQTDAKIALDRGDTDAAKEAMGQIQSLEEFIGFMNNKAVVLAKSGKSNESLDLYKKVLQSIPDKRKDIKAAVVYNVGLAYVRDQKLDKALNALKKAQTYKVERIGRKAESLQKRVEFAIKRKSTVELKSSGGSASSKGDDGADQPDESHSEVSEKSKSIVAAIDAERGTLCCYKIYFEKAEPSELAMMLLAKKLPTYTPRKAIERDAAHGVEKMMHQTG